MSVRSRWLAHMGAALVTDVVVVQHAEKHAEPGDPGLTDRGHDQALAVAELLSGWGVVAVYSSPLRRALDTARVIATRVGADLRIDDRLRERMNWDDPEVRSFEDFVAEWWQATEDREFMPSVGDSSRSAGTRFRAFLEEIADRHPGGLVVAVSHFSISRLMDSA